MKTYWLMSENGWEYESHITVRSKEAPVVTTVDKKGIFCPAYRMDVDGVSIWFDEEIVQNHKRGNEQDQETESMPSCFEGWD